MRLFVTLIVTMKLFEMVGGWKFPPSQLGQPERFQAHSHQKELSRRGRSLHQELFLSREARDQDEESQPPPFSSMLEHSWQPEDGDSICNSQFVPDICVCSSGWSKLYTDPYSVGSRGLLHLPIQPQASYTSLKPGKLSTNPS